MSRQAVLAYSAENPHLSGKHYEDLQSLISDLKKSLSDAAVNHQPVVLVKGSRFMRMERIVKSLVEESR
jgi:UDP-N-acetylmuramyl pentapeptide synthase